MERIISISSCQDCPLAQWRASSKFRSDGRECERLGVDVTIEYNDRMIHENCPLPEKSADDHMDDKLRELELLGQELREKIAQTERINQNLKELMYDQSKNRVNHLNGVVAIAVEDPDQTQNDVMDQMYEALKVNPFIPHNKKKGKL